VYGPSCVKLAPVTSLDVQKGDAVNTMTKPNDVIAIIVIVNVFLLVIVGILLVKCPNLLGRRDPTPVSSTVSDEERSGDHGSLRGLEGVWIRRP
jgi:hypothetical protein